MKYDVIIIGAGAAGLMCAIEAGKRGRSVLLLDHAKKAAEKIRISGGGRCNFTNLHVTPANYLSQNPRFCLSALKSYTQHDFIALVEKHQISYHEKTLGQLFCDGSSQQIIDMLLRECQQAQVRVQLETTVNKVSKCDDNVEHCFALMTNQGDYSCTSLVIATGGKSIPKMGATGFGYSIANQFGLPVITPEAALVPIIFEGEMLRDIKQFSGISLPVTITCGKKSFHEAMLFTHRGLSGPAILQISSYWQKGAGITINLTPEVDIFALLTAQKKEHPKRKPFAVLSNILPNRLAAGICEEAAYDVKLAEIGIKHLQRLADRVNRWVVVPSGTEGFRTAEVTIGGVDTTVLSSKRFESQSVKGLYFIGEVVDVTGHLGGFNFQWAWSSGYAAGQWV